MRHHSTEGAVRQRAPETAANKLRWYFSRYRDADASWSNRSEASPARECEIGGDFLRPDCGVI